MKRHDIQERRSKLIDEGKALAAKAELEKRDLTPPEAEQLARITASVEGLNSLERSACILEEAERRVAADPVTDHETACELRHYNLAKAMQEAANGSLSGVEAEFHQELAKGRTNVRGIMVPTEIILGGYERRDGQSVGTPAAGGTLVATALLATADRFRPALKIETMGATVLRGLSGNVDAPKLTASGAAYWVAENAGPARTATSFDKVSLSPNTVAAEYKISRRLLLQSSTSIDALLRKDLGYLMAQALDSAAINGPASSATTPTGLLNAGIQSVTASTALSDTAADLIASLELDDVSGSTGFLTNPTVMKEARKLKDAMGHTFTTSEIFHGETVEVTTQVPHTLGSTNDKSAILYGAWEHLMLGYWSAVDIVANPYHPDVSGSGGVLLNAFLDADVAVRHVEAFSYALVA